MTRDPYLLTTLHEVLSAVTSVRSTAAILVEEGEISAEWRQRFHANLHQDSQRLSLTAQALVAYLDSFEAEGQATTPRRRSRPGWPNPALRTPIRAILPRMRRGRWPRICWPDAGRPGRAVGPRADRGDPAAGTPPDPVRLAARLGQPWTW
ncbi:hypothetical protein [Paracoccus marcusii]|uniref:hypothetical protein n=1 Tax=Paracoccus marcusii TaxID=59779 RepID=UPI002ED2A5AD